MKTMKTVAACTCIFLLCANLGEQTSKRKEKPDVNIQGIVTTQAGEQIKAHNITISGKYEQIKVYNKSGTGNPQNHEGRLDLDELKEIIIRPIKKSLFTYQAPEEKKSDGTKVKPKAVEYIEFEAVYKNSKTKHYLIERNKKFCYDEMIGEAAAEQSPKIEAIKKVTIKKIISQKTDEEEDAQNNKRIELMHEAIDEIEGITRKITTQTKDGLEKAKGRLLELTQELRDKLGRVFR